MADTSHLERTEQPTAKQLERAREQGNVPRSREIATVMILAIGGGMTWLLSHSFVSSLNHILIAAFTFERAQAFDLRLLCDRLGGYIVEMAITCIPIAASFLLAAIISPLVLGGWLFNIGALTPKFERMNPIRGLSKLCSMQALVELGKAIGKTVLIGIVAWIIMHRHIDAMLQLSVEPLRSGSRHMSHLLWSSFMGMVCALIFIALFDAPYQLWNYTRKLRMTRQEVKQEHKEAEGDPHIKSRIRAMQRAMARRRMMAAVPTADVVVTNPTRYAVALKYTETTMRAPQVIAKGTDAIADKIRATALANQVPILAAPLLARALHFYTEIGDEIPEALYAAVAEVLAYIFQLRVYQTQGGTQPQTPSDLAVPKEMADPDNKLHIRHQAAIARSTRASS